MPTVERSIRPKDELAVILGALNALKRGDPAVRLPLEWTGVAGRVADVFNDVAERNERMAQELARLSRVVGKEGQARQARLARGRHADSGATRSIR